MIFFVSIKLGLLSTRPRFIKPCWTSQVCHKVTRWGNYEIPRRKKRRRSAFSGTRSPDSDTRSSLRKLRRRCSCPGSDHYGPANKDTDSGMVATLPSFMSTVLLSSFVSFHFYSIPPPSWVCSLNAFRRTHKGLVRPQDATHLSP
jgi:hypothetical protein